MSAQTTTHILIYQSIGRPSDEEWEIIEPTYISFWKTALNYLCSHSYNHDSATVSIKIDWPPYVRHMENTYSLKKSIYAKEFDENSTIKSNQSRKIIATCSITGKNKLSEYSWYPDFFIEYYTYEVFICMNLACPGSTDFMGLAFKPHKNKRAEKFGLSAFYFDEWLVASTRGQKPKALNIDPATVLSWIRNVNPAVTQRAESGTQRALFAMYHMCRSDGHIDFVIWLFTALESILSTRVGESFNGMVRRASLILGFDTADQKKLSRNLRKLYDLRSSFVHGGYAVAHPLHHESIDPRIDKDYSDVLQHSIYGFSLLAAILQSMIVKNQHILIFEERLVTNTRATSSFD